jgi:hypothetical protein
MRAELHRCASAFADPGQGHADGELDEILLQS